MGFSPIGIRGFGRIFVKGSSLVPFPPAIINTGVSFLEYVTSPFFRKSFHRKRPITLSFSSIIRICLITYFFINSKALFLSFELSILIGFLVIIELIGSFKSIPFIRALLTSPSVTIPNSFFSLSVTTKTCRAALSICLSASLIETIGFTNTLLSPSSDII